jgi:hypothetical protein
MEWLVLFSFDFGFAFGFGCLTLPRMGWLVLVLVVLFFYGKLVLFFVLVF